MSLMPRKVKYRKTHRGRRKGRSKGALTVAFGDYGLQAVEPGWLSAAQIESLRVTINRKIKKIGKIFLRVFPDKPVTKKPAETRMGKGKGAVEYYVAVVKPGRIMFEIGGLPDDVAIEALKLAQYKLSIKTKIVSSNIGDE